MAYKLIDPDGLFNGDRFTLVSDSARYAWPYFWCASNTMGRIELNYHKVVSTAFSRFKIPPVENHFWGWVTEFHDAYLLFVYRGPNGQLWGQWETSEEFLPRYKLAADSASPAPNHSAFTAWREEYLKLKTELLRAKWNDCIDSGKISEPLEIFPLVSVVVGVDVGVDVDVVEKPLSPKPCSASLAPQGNPPADTSSNPDLRGPGTSPEDFELTPVASAHANKREEFLTAQKLWFDLEFWPLAWRTSDKEEALKAFRKTATSPASKDRIITAVKLATPEILSREKYKRPYMSTWLNKKRFNDDPEAVVPSTVATDAELAAAQTARVEAQRQGWRRRS